MYRTQCVLALLGLYVGLVHSFSWDIVVSGKEELQFYNNGTLTHTEVIPSCTLILSIAYDSVHNRLLLGGSNEICSFDIATRKIQSLIKSNLYGNIRIAYDSASMLLFWIEQGNSLNSILLKPGYYNTVNINLFNLQKQPKDIKDIAVDSCGGYIYWTTDNKIERGRFDGSQREVVDIDRSNIRREAMVIDQQTQKIYWLEQHLLEIGPYNTIESADLNGENRRTLYSERDTGKFKALTVSKDFVNLGLGGTFWQISKNPPLGWNVKPKQFLSIPDIAYDGMFVQGTASNYKIEDQTPEIQYCEALRVPSDSDSLNDSTDVSLLCVHGKKVSGESRCECTQGYIGERCEVPVFLVKCLQTVSLLRDILNTDVTPITPE